MLKIINKFLKKRLRFSKNQSYKIGLEVYSVTVTIILILVMSFLITRANPDSISDTFTDETQIASVAKLEIATTTGQVTLAECYSPNSEWAKETDTIVRDISSLSASATTSKDIYCDDYNCILWADGVALSSTTTVCIATNSNVYGGLLWSKTDNGSEEYGERGSPLYGDQIGGTHASGLMAGNNNVNKENRDWINRYHSTGTFPAMAACKAKGSGWKLPNALDLDGIRDQDKGSAPYTRLPNIISGDYWTSTDSGDTNKATPLDFSDGNIGPGGGTDYRNNNRYVRCVREH